jgi:hypothetical protein
VVRLLSDGADLRRAGHDVRLRQARHLTTKMGLTPIPAAHADGRAVQHLCWCADVTLCVHAPRLPLPGGYGLGYLHGIVLADIEHDRCGLLRRGVRRSAGPLANVTTAFLRSGTQLPNARRDIDSIVRFSQRHHQR